MDISIVVSILGIVATITFGILSIDLFRRKKNPGKLTLVKQMEIGLFNNIAQNFEEIAILYKGNPIKENVIYLKATIINDGDIDIDGSRVEKTLTLVLTEGLKWIKAKVTSHSKELICTDVIEADNLELKFNFGLIRKKEHFQFEALIETTNSNQNAEDIFDKIDILHRIPNTQKVKQVSVLSEEQMTKKKKKIKTYSITFGAQLLIILLALFIQTIFFKNIPIHYMNNNVEYSAKAIPENKIKLTNLITSEEKIITIVEFQAKDKYQPFIPNQTFWDKIENMKYMIPLMLLMIILFVGEEYLELRKSNKLYDIFNDKNESK